MWESPGWQTCAELAGSEAVDHHGPRRWCLPVSFSSRCIITCFAAASLHPSLSLFLTLPCRSFYPSPTFLCVHLSPVLPVVLLCSHVIRFPSHKRLLTLAPLLSTLHIPQPPHQQRRLALPMWLCLTRPSSCSPLHRHERTTAFITLFLHNLVVHPSFAFVS